MDDADWGSNDYLTETNREMEDPFLAMAIHSLASVSPRMLNWEQQMKQILDWAVEYRADAVLEMIQFCDEPRGFRHPLLGDYLSANGIRYLSVERDYPFSSQGQLKTRVEVLLEMLSSREKTGGIR